MNKGTHMLAAAFLSTAFAIGAGWVIAQEGVPSQPGQPSKAPPPRPDTPPDQPAPDREVRQRTRRPFLFESTESERSFNESARRLVTMERSLDLRNRALLAKLAEARQLTGQRQNDAILDVLQQVIQDHENLHRYLVQSRTAWTGDLDDENQVTPDEQERRDRPRDPDRPTPPRPPESPRP